MIRRKAKTQKLYSHDDLVTVARDWLRRRHTVVTTELTVSGAECADALGFKHGGQSTLVECKASRSDFLADRKKWFRQMPEQGMGLHRYFLAPAGMLDKDELPPGWGLLEWNGLTVREKANSVLFGLRNDGAEKTVLISCLRRLGTKVSEGVSISCYSHDLYENTTGRQSKNKATLSVENGSK